jgi:hypothetical protein
MLRSVLLGLCYAVFWYFFIYFIFGKLFPPKKMFESTRNKIIGTFLSFFYPGIFLFFILKPFLKVADNIVDRSFFLLPMFSYIVAGVIFISIPMRKEVDRLRDDIDS